MIVTCASCLTKFNLDEARIPPRGAKVRCSRCKHVFFVPPPPPPQEEVVEDFESFAREHEELIEPGRRRTEFPQPPMLEEERIPMGEEEAALFAEERPAKRVRSTERRISREQEVPRARGYRPERAVRKARRGPSLFFALLIILLLLVFGAFYLWTELESGGKLSAYLRYPVQKATELWEQVWGSQKWGSQKEGLVIKELNQYEESIGNIPLLVVEGQVGNQSGATKKYVKVRVTIYDQQKNKVTEREALCGRAITRDELRKMPPAFFRGDFALAPKSDKEMAVPAGTSIPFTVILRDLPGRAKEFSVQIVEAPNL
jgi:predicted Zn finger-like uncharacterized protein